MEELSFKKRVQVCFKANDVRCVAGAELDEKLAYLTGRAVVKFLKCKKFIVGHDVRISSHKIRDVFIKGILDQGCSVIDIDEVDTPGLYFASGHLDLPGGMITASHNPAKYNGIKLVRSCAEPIGEKTGLRKIMKLVSKEKFGDVGRRGRLVKRDISKAYRKHVLGFVDASLLKGLKIVVDAGNGMAGKMIPIVYNGLGVRMDKLDFKLDGSFPKHDANPSRRENIADLQKRVLAREADFGIAFDGDMDRVAFVDERGQAVDSSVIAALIVNHFCSNEGVVYSSSASKIIPETVECVGGRAYEERVGHSFIKARMAKTKSIFGAEHSAHYYYKENFYSDSGLITSLIVCEIYRKAGKKFSELTSEFEKYSRIPEESVIVSDKGAVLKKVEKHYRGKGGRVKKMDGLKIDFGSWWFSVRPSNTEPLLRVNAESENGQLLKKKALELMRVIKDE